MPEFEAVGACLCRIENAYFQTVDPFLLYTKDKRLAREADNPNGRRIDLWSPSFSVDCNPNFEGNLRSDLVKLQRRQQANNRLGNFAADFEQADVF